MEIIPRVRLRGQFELAERVVSLDDAPSGTLVRVTGTIGPQATVPTLFRGVPAVLFRNRVASADETRGQDFLLDLDQGGQAKVAVRRSTYHGRADMDLTFFSDCHVGVGGEDSVISERRTEWTKDATSSWSRS
jgi:hypothetical protein